MIDKVTDWAEIVGCFALALGAAWLAGEHLGIGWGIVAFGTAILFMSALVSAVAGRRKDGRA